jgi:hypothetical protein
MILHHNSSAVTILQLVTFIVLMSGVVTYAGEGVLDNVEPSGEIIQTIRLESGELLMGFIKDKITSNDKGVGIKFETQFGIITLYELEIAEVLPLSDSYKHNHRVFLLPTAEPIKKNHFIGNVQLLGMWAGFGISDILSVTAVRTFVPNIPSSDQLTYLNAKATVYDYQYPNDPGGLTLAVGGTLTWLNAPNRLTHIFGSATFTRVRSKVTATVFANLSGDSRELFVAQAGTYGNALVRYPGNAIGLGIGLDTRFPGRQDLHFLAEFWNSDLSKPSNSALILGLRATNSSVSFDFGIAVISAPAFLPVVSFAWTPF